MIYCISDIHGALKEFKALLELINLDLENDELYLLGDYVDFNEYSIETLLYVMELSKNKNVHCLIGNHDYMFLEAIKEGKVDLGYLRNGGNITFEGYLKLDDTTKQSVYEFLLHLPLYYEREYLGQKYYLVHASKIQNDLSDAIWYRRTLGEKHFEDDTIMICGHTPTGALKEFEEQFEVIFDGNTIMIDCFAKGFAKNLSYEESRLACIRLDDKKVFYVKKQP